VQNGSACEETGTTHCAKPFDLPFGFHSAYSSTATGLVYFRNRWYSPEAAQWLSQDPMGFVDSFNLYAFNAFDSVNLFDPMGLDSKGMAEAPLEKPFNWVDDGTKKAKAPNALDDANTLLCARGVNCRDREDPRTPADPAQRLASEHLVEAVVVGLGGFAKGVTIGLGVGLAASASPTLAAALIVGGSALLAYQLATGGVGQLSAALTQAASRLAQGKLTLSDVESFTTTVGLAAGTAGAGAAANLAGVNAARAAQVAEAQGTVLPPLAPAERVLNLGSGANPMKGAVNVDIKSGAGVDVSANANALPFASEAFTEVHAINPYGFNPVSRETARVMCPGGTLSVSGTARNTFAQPVSAEAASAVGLELVETTTLSPAHQFGVQRTSSGAQLSTGSSSTTVYRKLP
jgi:RHS repeat-associated protein